MTEAELQSRILLALGQRPDVRIWRNNVGAAQVDGRFMRFGLPGSADLIGIVRPSGRLLAVEVKSRTGRLTQAQKTFGRVIEAFGGIYVVARSVEAAVAAVDAAQNGGGVHG